MSAHVEVIDEYLEKLVRAVADDSRSTAVDLMLRIRSNYLSALSDVERLRVELTDTKALLDRTSAYVDLLRKEIETHDADRVPVHNHDGKVPYKHSHRRDGGISYRTDADWEEA